MLREERLDQLRKLRMLGLRANELHVYNVISTIITGPSGLFYIEIDGLQRECGLRTRSKAKAVLDFLTKSDGPEPALGSADPLLLYSSEYGIGYVCGWYTDKNNQPHSPYDDTARLKYLAKQTDCLPVRQAMADLAPWLGKGSKKADKAEVVRPKAAPPPAPVAAAQPQLPLEVHVDPAPVIDRAEAPTPANDNPEVAIVEEYRRAVSERVGPMRLDLGPKSALPRRIQLAWGKKPDRKWWADYFVKSLEAEAAGLIPGLGLDVLLEHDTAALILATKTREV